MSASLSIAQPEPLNKSGNLADNWRRWKQNFEIYLIASGTNPKDDKIACALFLHTIGQYGRDIFNDLDCSESEVNKLDDLFSKFDNYCNPKINITFSRYQFFNTKQEKKQPFDKYLLSLKQKSKNCEFGDLDNSLIMTQIISGISNVKLREKLLRMPDLDLNQTIEICRVNEAAEAQAQAIAAAAPKEKKKPKPNQENQQKETAPTSKTTENKKQGKNQKNDKNLKSQQGQEEVPSVAKKDMEQVPRIMNCLFCGNAHLYRKCPAFGTTCQKCQKPNHFAKVCKN